MKSNTVIKKALQLLTVLTTVTFCSSVRENRTVPLHELAIEKHCQINSNLVSALIMVESAFDSGAKSRAGARGLMQVRPIVLRDLDYSDSPSRLYESVFNIQVGCEYLEGLIVRYRGNVYKALVAYNQGPTKANKYTILQAKKDKYVCKIFKEIKELESKDQAISRDM